MGRVRVRPLLAESPPLPSLSVKSASEFRRRRRVKWREGKVGIDSFGMDGMDGIAIDGMDGIVGIVMDGIDGIVGIVMDGIDGIVGIVIDGIDGIVGIVMDAIAGMDGMGGIAARSGKSGMLLYAFCIARFAACVMSQNSSEGCGHDRDADARRLSSSTNT